MGVLLRDDAGVEVTPVGALARQIGQGAPGPAAPPNDPTGVLASSQGIYARTAFRR